MSNEPQQNGYYMVNYWFISDLKLKGTKLIIFSIIYGFSQDGKSYFTGSQEYLAKFANVNRPTANIVLNQLIDIGYIKVEIIQNKKAYAVNLEKINSVRKSNTNCLKVEQTKFENQTDGVRKSNKNCSKIEHNNIDNIVDNIVDNSSSVSPKKIVEYWNDSVKETLIKPITKLTPHTKRYESLNARCNEYGCDKVIEAIDKIKNSDFLQGKNNKGWVITFDWFVLPNNFPKVLEGNYDNHQASSGSGRYEY